MRGRNLPDRVRCRSPPGGQRDGQVVADGEREAGGRACPPRRPARRTPDAGRVGARHDPHRRGRRGAWWRPRGRCRRRACRPRARQRVEHRDRPPVGRRCARRRRWRAARARARWPPDRGAARSTGRRARAASPAPAPSAARRARRGSRSAASRSPTCRQAAPRASAHSMRTGRRLPSMPCRKGSGNEPTTAGVRALAGGDVGPDAVAAVDRGVVGRRDPVDPAPRRWAGRAGARRRVDAALDLRPRARRRPRSRG